MKNAHDLTKKGFFIYNSFVVYLQSKRHGNCDVIIFIANVGAF